MCTGDKYILCSTLAFIMRKLILDSTLHLYIHTFMYVVWSAHVKPELSLSLPYHFLVMGVAVAAVNDIPGITRVLLFTQQPLLLSTEGIRNGIKE